jgi:hypothetical protein
MLATLLTLAAETAEEETSKTPFYILGALAAVWAIVLFAVGMRSQSFPGGETGQRGVVAVTVVLMAAAMATAVITG